MYRIWKPPKHERHQNKLSTVHRILGLHAPRRMSARHVLPENNNLMTCSYRTSNESHQQPRSPTPSLKPWAHLPLYNSYTYPLSLCNVFPTNPSLFNHLKNSCQISLTFQLFSKAWRNVHIPLEPPQVPRHHRSPIPPHTCIKQRSSQTHAGHRKTHKWSGQHREKQTDDNPYHFVITATYTTHRIIE